MPATKAIEYPVFVDGRLSGKALYRRRRVVERLVEEGSLFGWNVYVYEGEHLPDPEVAVARLKAAGISPHYEDVLL